MARNLEVGGPGELRRLRERVASLENQIAKAQAEPLWASLDRSPVAIWTTRDDRIAFANEASRKLIGAAACDELVGRSIFDFIAPEYRDASRARFGKRLDIERETPIVEEKMIRQDGTVIDVQVTTFQLPEDNARFRHISIIDITARKEAERRLFEIDQRFQELANNIREVFWIFDPSARRMLYVSPAYELIWQRTGQSLLENSMSWADAIHPEDVERVLARFHASEAFKEEYRILRASGEVRWIRTSTVPICNGGGKLLRVVGSSEDISEWKRLEQQLVQSQKMDAIGRLAGGVAHDFNNLLTVINGYASMLAVRRDLPSDVIPDLLSIGRAGARAASLTAQLLAFSHNQHLQTKSLDLNGTVREMEPILRRLIREDVDLQTVLYTGYAGIKADPTRIGQVLMNLVINARDAIEGTGTITIETGRVAFDTESARYHGGVIPGIYALLAVSDTGRGMSAHVLERIFEPFFSTKGLGQGTG